MSYHERIFMSESVTPGHPDKLCDQVSDATVDAFLQQDSQARIEVECAIATGVLFIAARFAAQASVDVPSIARGVIADAGYVEDGFDARSCSILTTFTDADEGRRPRAQPADTPAREQANAFGFACRETPVLMPLPIWLAHRLARALDDARRTCEWLGPDGKTQVAVQYRDGRPHRIHSLTLLGAARGKQPARATIDEAVRELIVAAAFRDQPLKPDAQTRIHFNPVGPYLVGGPSKHSGLTGRKNGIDLYGEYSRQSGAALSGKDPSRIDRVGAYAARYAAKNIVAAKVAERCEVHLAYAIGVVEPLSIHVDTFGTGKLPDYEIAKRVARAIDLRPSGIEQRFRLRDQASVADAAGFFRPLAVYGHVGRTDVVRPWEETDLVPALTQ
jgi:S-adenosylmethionine synthetase